MVIKKLEKWAGIYNSWKSSTRYHIKAEWGQIFQNLQLCRMSKKIN